ncbi:alpha-amylase family glycosyl hydrolase [Pelotalea chapellei]|uniref:Alpha-amylase n=1 Tax=Pelotalea chapellei TaxID=44671 RepID=A0ABS5U920_9BACT|nr:alpha-amylase family glycosyl hydrolase [Pelotalea chapellei]MBT1072128.1 alpha-amylase [Pelotalea chapellei]
MTEQPGTTAYFPHVIQISAQYWRSLDLGALSRLIAERNIPPIIFYRQMALKLNRLQPDSATPVHAGHLNLYATLQTVQRFIIDVLAEQELPDVLLDALQRSSSEHAFPEVATNFVELYPPQAVLNGSMGAGEWLAADTQQVIKKRMLLREILLLRMASGNPAIDSFRAILDDKQLSLASPAYAHLVDGVTGSLAKGPFITGLNMTLADALQAPVKASPDSLSGQVGYIREQWQELLPPELLKEVTTAFDILLEEERSRGWGGEPGPPPVLEFNRSGKGGAGEHGGGANEGHGGGHAGSSVFGGYDYPEYEYFSVDADWMSNVVLMAKMVYVWLDQLSKQHGYPITRLDQIPDCELNRLAEAGFTGLWLIGIWERSAASQRIKQLCGNPDAIASAYSLYDYEIAADLGGWEALGNLRERAAHRGIRLASDMVPNHTGIYSRWVIQHPDWFVQTDYPPFPTYQFNGEDLSHSGEMCIQVEDGYWTKTDAAVVFRMIERNTGRVRYIYHGNDGTSIPWNDTAQLNYLIPEVREAVIQTILHVARNFPIIRFDAAMTLAKKHYQRLWFPIRGLGGGIPSRAEHSMTREEFDTVFPVEFWREVVDRVAVEAPGTLLLAEAFWMMEGYFVRTLGMHRVYNSAFMNMLKMEENHKYRQTIKNVLEFNPEVLKRFVNFMNNPDEKTAVEQFGTQGKYFGACMMMVTMPGLPMFGHGQIEGLHEKYGMEYKRAYWDEPVDQGLVRGHEMWIFPLLRHRGLFSGSENFSLYDFYAGDHVDENVFAYSNRVGDHRALILYHNRYATTAGWIRKSTSFAVKGTNGDMELRHTTLAKALGVTAGDDLYLAFRDIYSGLEYLRNGTELSQKGLYAELGEYEFSVFLDFREIQDDADCTWKLLCETLNGSGVESLEEARLQVQFNDLNQAFNTVLECIPAESGKAQVGVVIGDAAALDKAAADFFDLLERQGEVIATTPPLPSQPLLLVAAALAPARKPLKGTDLQPLLRKQLDSAGVRLLLSWLLLRPSRPDTVESYGFDYTLHHGVNPAEPMLVGPAYIQLLKALLSAGPTDLAQPANASLAVILSSSACQKFIQVHESEGEEWFNKERFELFLQWLVITHLAMLAGESPKVAMLNEWLNLAVLEVQAYADLAAHAGYRLNLFLRMLNTPGEKEEVPVKPVPPKR